MKTELYIEALKRLPQEGKQIIGYQEEENIVVYQAYNTAIATFAVHHQFLGGNHFSYDRMSWIKPGFLWMMYRCGWATKENQERVLAIWIRKSDFENILSEAVPSTYKPKQYSSMELWKQELKKKDVRLQWDPDHDPYGRKLDRKAIQIGLKGETLKAFGKQYIQRIEDITDFVKEQGIAVERHCIEQLLIPEERVINIGTIAKQRIGL